MEEGAINKSKELNETLRTLSRLLDIPIITASQCNKNHDDPIFQTPSRINGTTDVLIVDYIGLTKCL